MTLPAVPSSMPSADAQAGPIWIAYDETIDAAPGTGPLAGKRLAVEDKIDVAGFGTTAACPDFRYEPERSATVIERLQAAGMRVAGKTNLDQFACGLVGTRSPDGAVPNAFDARDAERHAAIRSFFDTHADAMDPTVRAIVGSGKEFSAADLFDAIDALALARRKAARLWDRFDLLVVPTAPTMYRIDALLAEPLALDRSLGTCTNFVNLLDMAAIAVPSSMRPDGLPFGITLFLCESSALTGAEDISHHGGWRAWLARAGRSATNTQAHCEAPCRMPAAEVLRSNKAGASQEGN